MSGRANPPAIARALLLAVTPSRWRRELDGDLLEGYLARCRSMGPWRARLWYWRQLGSVDVIRLRFGGGGSPRPQHGQGRERDSGAPALEGIWRDVRHTARMLKKSPAFTLLVLITLALGIGANTAIFSAVNGVLLKPLPYLQPDRLVMVFRTVPRFGFTRSTASYPDYADWRAEAYSFSGLAAYGYAPAVYGGGGGGGAGAGVGGGSGAERWIGYRVTANLMALLGVNPSLGRTFGLADDRPGAPTVVLLSYATWKSRFGGSEEIVGRTITLDGEPATIVGVMPSDFAFPSQAAEFWVPLRGDADRMERDTNFLTVIGRLATGVTIDAARAEMEELAARIDREAPDGNEGFGVKLESRHAFEVRNARTALLVFLGAVALVLVVACTNVANLMLSRGTSRRRELAVRTALGASRGRLGRQLLTESVVLAVLGATLGLAVAAGLLRLLVRLGSSQLPRLDEVAIDPTVLAFTGLIAVLCGIGFGTVPALLEPRLALTNSLKHGGHATGIGRFGRRFQETLVVAQVALAIVLSIGAGLLANSFNRLVSVEPGFDPTNVVAARVTTPELDFEPDPQMSAGRRLGFYDELETRVAGLPGVQRVGLSYAIPFSHHSFGRYFAVEGSDQAGEEAPIISGNVVAGDYFRAMGIPLIRGRAFGRADGREAAPVLIVNQTLAQRFWPDQDPIGQRVWIGDSDAPPATVVGVAADVRQRSLDAELEPFYYRPLAQALWPDEMYVVARSAVEPSQLVPRIREQLWAMDPQLVVTEVTTADDLIDGSIAAPRFRTLLLTAFGAFAVTLALVGIYGVISHAVGERRREIGVRIALGAQRRAILGMIISRGLRLSLIGIAFGVVGALGVTRFLAGMLFGVTPYDVPTFAAAALTLLVVSLLSCWLPAQRAARVDPQESLRYE